MTATGRSAGGIVTLAALDVRRRPSHAAEMGSQLLMGEVVRVLRRGSAGRWLRVENRTDRYRGWVRAWGVVVQPLRRIAAWQRASHGRLTGPWLEVRERPGRGEIVTPLFWGARVVAGPTRGRYRRIVLPDGRPGWVEKRGIAVGTRAVRSLRERVRELMGVPYLWGGRTPAGFDCSGLVQMLLAEQGCRVPRDAADQERSCRPLRAGERPEPGDLAFFGRRGGPAGHVGIMMDRGLYAHARGQVRLNHLHKGNILYDNELGAQFRGVRRPRGLHARARSRGPDIRS
jgi:hypothetical protein